ncbi:MAG: hypothetical protein H0U62_11155 [Actinobacteria bacterium]|nr:hypothetical protein [Actinomycetota bacterium]
MRDLLACFDLKAVVVSLDAMHTQTETAKAITAAGGHYLFTVLGRWWNYADVGGVAAESCCGAARLGGREDLLSA